MGEKTPPSMDGIDPNRLGFARWLLANGRISDNFALTPEFLAAEWDTIIERVKRDSPIIAALLRGAAIAGTDGTVVTIRVRHRVRHAKLVEHETNASALVMKAMGQPITLHLLPPP